MSGPRHGIFFINRDSDKSRFISSLTLRPSSLYTPSPASPAQFSAIDKPVTDHTFEDCRLMMRAQEMGLPLEVGLVEFQKLLTKLGWVVSADLLSHSVELLGRVTRLSYSAEPHTTHPVWGASRLTEKEPSLSDETIPKKDEMWIATEWCDTDLKHVWYACDYNYGYGHSP